MLTSNPRVHLLPNLAVTHTAPCIGILRHHQVKRTGSRDTGVFREPSVNAMLCSVFLPLFLSASLLQAICPAYAQEPKDFAVGSMNGHRLKIPRNFMLFDVSYEGENIWAGRRREVVPTLDTPLHNFGMFLRLDTMEPRGASLEEEAQFSLSKALDSGQWTIVSVEILGRPAFKTDDDWLRDMFSRVKNPHYLKKLRYDKFIDDAGDIFDLNHFVSTYSASHQRHAGDFPPTHLYWNSEVKSTFISCDEPRPEYVVKIVHCSQTIYLKDLNAMATASYDESHLRQWRTIAKAITDHTQSFAQ